MVDELGMLRGEGEGDGGTQTMTHDVTASNLKGGNDVGDDFRERFDGIIEATGWWFFTFPRSGQVDRYGLK